MTARQLYKINLVRILNCVIITVKKCKIINIIYQFLIYRIEMWKTHIFFDRPIYCAMSVNTYILYTFHLSTELIKRISIKYQSLYNMDFKNWVFLNEIELQN